MIRRIPRKWRWRAAALALLGGALAFLGLQDPQHARITVRYAGSPEWVPEEYTLYQSLWPRRCIPFVSCEWHFLQGSTQKTKWAMQRLRATPEGVTFEVNNAPRFSLGSYEAVTMSIEANPGPRSPERFAANLDHSPSRYTEMPGGSWRGDYHILDIGTPSTFRLPLPVLPGRTETTIDFAPILFTRFDGPPNRDQWLTFGTHCTRADSPLLMSVHAPRVFRYHTELRPPLRPGQRPPSSEREATVFLLEDLVIEHERPGPEAWKRMLQHAVYPDNVRLSHEPTAKSLTVEVTAPPSEKAALAQQGLIVVAGTPSTDGRYFGYDCVLIRQESKGRFNPVLYTVFDDLPRRDDWTLLGNRCRYTDAPRLAVKPGTTHTFRYHTTIMPPPKDQDPIPQPKGKADVFVIDSETVQKLEERPTPEEWAALQKSAIHPKELRLQHDSARKSIAVTLDHTPTSDYAIVVGTPSSDGRFFGVECVQFAGAPGAPTSEDGGP